MYAAGFPKADLDELGATQNWIGPLLLQTVGVDKLLL